MRKLVNLNVGRFRDWNADFDFSNARQAMFAFKGDVYTGLDAYDLDDQEIDFVQQHLADVVGALWFIASFGFDDAIPSEMGTKLNNNTRGHNPV